MADDTLRPLQDPASMPLPFVLLAILLVVAPAWAQVEVTYIANEGFLLASGESKVLVDALLDEGLRGYARPTEPTRIALEAAQPPFDGVDLVLATHFHGDHFGPRAVSRHLAANPSALLVSTPQAIARLTPELSGRSRAVHPAEGEVERLTVGDVRLTVLNLHHGRDRDPPVQNLGFLIEMGGVMLLHVGDTEVGVEDVRAYRQELERVDLGLIPTWFLAYEGWSRVTREIFRPREIVMMHLAEADAPANYFGRFEGQSGLLEEIARRFPRAVRLERGQRYSVARPSRP